MRTRTKRMCGYQSNMEGGREGACPSIVGTFSSSLSPFPLLIVLLLRRAQSDTERIVKDVQREKTRPTSSSRCRQAKKVAPRKKKRKKEKDSFLLLLFYKPAIEQTTAMPLSTLDRDCAASTAKLPLSLSEAV